MALRYGSKTASALRYNSYSALILRYGSKIGWTSSGDSDEEVYTPTDSSYFTFTLLDDDTYSIAAKDITNMPAEVILPSTYGGKAVTKIADYAFVEFDFADLNNIKYCEAITKVVIPDSITSIGDLAFSNCLNLVDVTLGKNITSIGYGAFVQCAFTNISLPDNITSISDNTFNKCINLTNIIIPNEVASIGRYAFSGCSSLTSVYIPNSVTFIDWHAFSECANLTIYCEAEREPSGWYTGGAWNPDSRPVVWNYLNYFAFTLLGNDTYSIKAADTSNLPTDLIIPSRYNGKRVTAIDAQGFMGSFSETLTTPISVIIPNSVTTIGDMAFGVSASITSVTFGSSIQYIGQLVFGFCPNIESIIVEGAGKKYHSEENCLIETSTNTIVMACNSSIIPNYITSIGFGAFFTAPRITSVVLPDNLTSIGGSAFNNCQELSVIVIPKSVTYIGYQAFTQCRNLTIYCEADSQPSGWDEGWNYSDCPVVWGYTG